MFKILLPIDFSDSSVNASDYALSLAARVTGASILLMHCFYDYLADADTKIPPTMGMTASEAITERVLYRNEADAQEELSQIYNRLLRETQAAGSHVKLEHIFMNGLAEEKILEQIDSYKPDVVIMGTKGESDLSRSFFGTVTTEVVKKTKVPVLTVPQQFKSYSLKRVLFATDFDKADADSIARLTQLLDPFAPSVLCVHITEEEEAEDHENLKNLKQQLQASAPSGNVRYTLLEGDDVADTLEEFSKREQVDLLALTTRERGTWDSIFNPSLAKKLVLHAAVPLLIFHSTGNS